MHQAATSTVGVRQSRKKCRQADSPPRLIVELHHLPTSGPPPRESAFIFQLPRRHFVEQFPSRLNLGQAIAAELLDHAAAISKATTFSRMQLAAATARRRSARRKPAGLLASAC